MAMIAAAKEAGILHASAHHSRHGYSGDQAIHDKALEEVGASAEELEALSEGD
jgi:hypothetical protein